MGRLAACSQSISSQQSGTITEARHYSSDLPQGGLEVPCTLRLSGDAKLGRSYKLIASKTLILTEFNLIVNHQFVKFNQIFQLYNIQ